MNGDACCRRAVCLRVAVLASSAVTNSIVRKKGQREADSFSSMTFQKLSLSLPLSLFLPYLRTVLVTFVIPFDRLAFLASIVIATPILTTENFVCCLCLAGQMLKEARQCTLFIRQQVQWLGEGRKAWTIATIHDLAGDRERERERVREREEEEN